VNGKQLEEQYVSHLSSFTTWFQLSHARDYVIYPENIRSFFSIEDTSLSQGNSTQ